MMIAKIKTTKKHETVGRQEYTAFSGEKLKCLNPTVVKTKTKIVTTKLSYYRFKCGHHSVKKHYSNREPEILPELINL